MAAPATPIAFVAGATGFVGRAVVGELRRRGARVIAHVRPDSSRLDDWRDRFGKDGAELDTTAWDEPAMTNALRALAPTHVFCLIGTTRGRARSDGVTGDIYEKIDVGLTRILAAAAAASGARPRFVYLSSVGASVGASSKYLQARARAEACVRGAGLSWAIARPSIISGPGRDDARAGERVAGAIGDGALAVIGLFGGKGVRAKYRSTTPAILAAALVRLGLDETGDRVHEGDELR